jgi:hypothetical protein
MSKIDELLARISDGAWHNLFEITRSLRIDYPKLEKIVKLLREFSFIQKKGNEIRIDFETKKLLESATRDLNRA